MWLHTYVSTHVDSTPTYPLRMDYSKFETCPLYAEFNGRHMGSLTSG